jgi:hypothetical protein
MMWFKVGERYVNLARISHIWFQTVSMGPEEPDRLHVCLDLGDGGESIRVPYEDAKPLLDTVDKACIK